MKSYRIALLICSILLLSACQEVTEKGPVEKFSAAEEENNVKQAKKEVMSIEEIKEHVLSSWEVQDGNRTADLYLIKDGGTTEVIDATSIFGKEGDKQYKGNLAFYLAEVNGTEGFLQDHLAKDLENVQMNLEASSFQEYAFGDQMMITRIQPEATNVGRLTMWHYTDGEIQKVHFDEEQGLFVTSNKVKFIKDRYLQTYLYNNGSDENEGVGWIYTTWKWDAAAHDFITYDIAKFTKDEEYGWVTGEYLTELWHKHGREYVLFPEITLTKETIALVEKGMLLDNSIHLGKSIDEVLEEFPDYISHDYYEGGYYYGFSGGSSYFYDEVTREITYITLSGASVINDLDSIKSIFGKPVDSGYDDMEETDYALFDIGEYKLEVNSSEAGVVKGIWLSK